jgi:uncharacterized protein (DUF58 family)
MHQEDLEKKIRHIQIHSRKVVTEMLAGEYKSCFKGMGIDFEDVREYQHGDDVRTIDWNVTARTSKPYVKQFMEERELTLYFLIDVSASGTFGSGDMTKLEVAAQIFALLAFASAHNNDNVGLILFSDQIELCIKPRKGSNNIMFMIHQILAHKPKSKKTNIAQALTYLRKVRLGRCVTFLFSDFIDQGYRDSMREVARIHDLVCVSFSDLRERELPNCGILEIVDAETGSVMTIDCSNKILREKVGALARQRENDLYEFCREINSDLLHLNSSDDYLHKIISFFRSRSDRGANAR